jgi:hypothetical protein
MAAVMRALLADKTVLASMRRNFEEQFAPRMRA